MIFNIVAFTHKGAVREMNQDVILVHDQVKNEGTFSAIIEGPTKCFVADGVGGHPFGDVAAGLLLQELDEKLIINENPEREKLSGLCHQINHQIIRFGLDHPQYEGMATTLSGIIFCENRYRILNAGDSRVLLLRNQKLRNLTHDQVLSSEILNSPITSYFGGSMSSLDILISSGQDLVMTGDIFMVSSDGIFKALTCSQIEKILSNSKSLAEKADFIFYKAIQNGAPDNISCIFIEVKQTGNSG